MVGFRIPISPRRIKGTSSVLLFWWHGHRHTNGYNGHHWTCQICWRSILETKWSGGIPYQRQVSMCLIRWVRNLFIPKNLNVRADLLVSGWEQRQGGDWPAAQARAHHLCKWPDVDHPPTAPVNVHCWPLLGGARLHTPDNQCTNPVSEAILVLSSSEPDLVTWSAEGRDTEQTVKITSVCQLHSS